MSILITLYLIVSVYYTLTVVFQDEEKVGHMADKYGENWVWIALLMSPITLGKFLKDALSDFFKYL